MPASRETSLGGAAGGEFLPTAWTQIRQARDADTAEARLAWDQLIAVYWKPVYFHIRRKGHSVEDAKDLTQGFFASLVERGSLGSVDRSKGKFRTFVRTSLDYFLSDEYDRRSAAKRRVPFDAARSGAQFSAEGSFEHDWAMTVLDRAFLALKEEAPREARVVEAQHAGEKTLAELAKELGTTEANVKVLAHRGRKRLKELIMRELRATVGQAGDEREELAELFRAFSL
jgi:RNA polymerase sigma-70 factor (ECF subfamily)